MLGLGLGMAKQRGIPFPTLPAVTGQTLIAREWFDADRTSVSAGAFTNVTGTAKGGFTRGPRSTDHHTRRSGSLRFPTAAEHAAGTDLFRGDIFANDARYPTCDLTSIHWGCWYRPQTGFAGVLYGANPGNNSILSYRTYTGPDYWIGNIVAIYDTATDKIILQFYGGDGSVTGDSPVSLSPDQWVYLALVVICTGGGGSRSYAIKAVYKTLTGSMTVFGTLAATSPYNTAVNKVVCEQRLIAGHGGATGRVACAQLYNVTDMTTGLIYPTDLDPPVELRKAFSMDAAATPGGLEGPFATPSELATAKRNIVFLGAAVPWKTSGGVDASFASMSANATAMKAFGTAVRADTNSRIPQGDILNIAAGDYYFTAVGQGDFGLIRGMDIQPADANNPPTFYLDMLYIDGWDAQAGYWSASAFVSGSVSRCGVWQGDGAGGWLPLYPVRISDATAGQAAVIAQEGSYHSEASASVAIKIHPYGNIDPNTVAWRISAPYLKNADAEGTVAGPGAFVIGDGRIGNIICRGGFVYTLDASDSLVAHPHVAFWDGLTGYTSVVVGPLSKEYGKHGIKFAPNVPRALIVRKNIETQSAPVGRIVGTITNATNANPIVITSAAHTLQTGAHVTVFNVAGNTAANVTNNAITRVDADRFSLDGVAGNGAYSGSGATWEVYFVGVPTLASSADVDFCGGPTPTAGDGVTCLHYDCIDNLNQAVVGSTTPVHNGSGQSFLFHAGHDSIFLFIGLYGCSYVNVADDSFFGSDPAVQAHEVGA